MANAELIFGDEMLDRAGEALRGPGVVDPRGDAERAIRAAFEGVPVSNYCIGILLQVCSHVICLTEGGGGAVFVPEDGESFTSLAHRRNYTFRKDGSLSSVSFTKLGEDWED